MMGEEPLSIAHPSAQCKMTSAVISQFFRLMAVGESFDDFSF